MSGPWYYRCPECRNDCDKCACPPHFSAIEADAIMRAVLSSQALAGVPVSREVVEAAWEAVKDEPLPDIG